MSLRLVPLGARHARDLVALAEGDAMTPWTATPPASVRQAVLAFVARAQRLRARGTHATFAACLGGRLVGIARLARDEAAPDRAELGYWIGPPDRGRGYATTTARQLVSHGFGRMGLALVFARCPVANRASARVLAKLGFRAVDLEPSHDPASPVRCYELTREEWGINP
jgi:RimJ/RimL family protein N-acetyltransferase